MTPVVDIYETINTSLSTSLGSDVYYEHGHFLDIANLLSQKGQNDTLKFQKYPLNALIQDFDEDHEIGEINIPRLKIILATQTKPTYTPDERYTNSFINTLYPIWEQLIIEIKNSMLVTWDGRFRKTDRLYWGKTAVYGNEGLILNDYIDAIEIEIKDLIINEFC